MIVCLLAIAAFGCGQTKKNHWQVAKFSGKVKSSHITEFRPMNNDNEGTLHSEQIAVFNTQGNIAEMELNMQGNRTKMKEEYNDKGLLAKSVSYNPTGDIVFMNELEYDDKGNKIEEKALFPDRSLLQRMTYKYDNKGREIEKNMCNAKNCYEKILSSYDSKGNLIKELKYDEKGELYATINYQYDSKNNRTEIAGFGKDGELLQRFTYKYDKQGNETEVTEYDGSNTVIDHKTFSYKYDSKGNWIEKREFVEGQVVAKFEQKLEYFE